MRRLLLIALLIPQGCHSQSPTATTPVDKFGTHVVTVDHVYDGDTFYFRMPSAWSELSMVGVRVLGIDAPEMRGHCPAERQQAISAQHAAQQLISRAGGHVELSGVRWDKYGGRIEANVRVDGQDLSSYLLSRNLAIPYYGGHRNKMGWCQ